MIYNFIIAILKFTSQFAKCEVIIQTLARYLNSLSARSFVHHNNSLFQSEVESVLFITQSLAYEACVAWACLHTHLKLQRLLQKLVYDPFAHQPRHSLALDYLYVMIQDPKY